MEIQLAPRSMPVTDRRSRLRSTLPGKNAERRHLTAGAPQQTSGYGAPRMLKLSARAGVHTGCVMSMVTRPAIVSRMIVGRSVSALNSAASGHTRRRDYRGDERDHFVDWAAGGAASELQLTLDTDPCLVGEIARRAAAEKPSCHPHGGAAAACDLFASTRHA